MSIEQMLCLTAAAGGVGQAATDVPGRTPSLVVSPCQALMVLAISASLAQATLMPCAAYSIRSAPSMSQRGLRGLIGHMLCMCLPQHQTHGNPAMFSLSGLGLWISFQAVLALVEQLQVRKRSCRVFVKETTYLLIPEDCAPLTPACARRSWLAAVFSVSDAELMHTAGLDALIYHRAFTFGILFLSPTTVLALTIRECSLRPHVLPSRCMLCRCDRKVLQLFEKPPLPGVLRLAGQGQKYGRHQ